MAPARPLHEIFEGLTGVGDAPAAADAALRAGGHADLPAELLAEAMVSYADTTRVEVAELLAPMVMAHRGMSADGAWVAGPEAAWELLATAAPAAFDALEGGAELDPAAPPPGWSDVGPPADPIDTAFGQGGAEPLGPAEPILAAAADPAPAGFEEPPPDVPVAADPWGLVPDPPVEFDGLAGLDDPADLDDLDGEG